MALKSWPNALAPLALAGLLATAAPVTAAPETGAAVKLAAKDDKSRKAKTEPAAAKPADKSKATDKKDKTAKKDAKASSKPAKETKPAAKDTKSKDAKSKDAKSKGGKGKDAKAQSAAAAKAAGGLAPPVAAALQPGLPQDNQPASSGVGLASAPESTASTDGRPLNIPPPASTIITAAAMDVTAVKRAAELVRNRKQSDANDLRKNVSDPVAKKLIEWVILRSDDSGADFDRHVAFITANPHWPSIVTLRRKAEAVAWQDRADNGRIRAYFGQTPPLTAKGKLAYARALMAQGDRKNAEALVRDTWRNDAMSQDVEKRVEEQFGEFLTRADHKARMDRRLYEKDDTDAGVRAAQRLGGHEPVIAKARIALLGKGGNKAAVDAVPAAARDDTGYKFARLQALRRADELKDAVALLKTVKPLDESHDLDEWWVERRLLARKLIEEEHYKDAYAVVREGTPPSRDNYRAEREFMCGWIALRFLKDPSTAYAHFAKVGEGIENPIALARGSYWMGRAAEAMGRTQQARTHYQDAARYPTAYYGQIARAKAGLGEMALNPMPALSSADRNKAMQNDVVRAIELLYAADARDLAWAALADFGDKSSDAGALTVLAEVTAKYKDARGMLLLGKLALARGYTLDHAAFPNIGVPEYTPIGPPVEPAIVYSIVRQESWFNPKTISSANALGLMQVTPPAGKYVAKKFSVAFDQKRLLNDNVYNVQMGSAELGDVIKDYRGSYIMAFAAYNAGRGRVKDWVSRFGDPRDPKVDPIDWVEMIPFAETRNYVQRVMENVQVYRVRFGGNSRLLIEADMRRGSATN